MRVSQYIRSAARLARRRHLDPDFEAGEAAATRSASAGLALIACVASIVLSGLFLVAGGPRDPVRYVGLSAAMAAAYLLAAVTALRAPLRAMHAVYFAVVMLGVASLVAYQLVEPAASGISLVSAGMLPMAAAAFSRWPTRVHVEWLGTVLLLFIALQFPPLAALLPAGSASLLLVGFATGAILSLSGQIALRTGRYRSYVLTHRLRETNRRLRRTLDEVRESRLTIRKLAGILPTCSACDRVRSDDDSEWMTLTAYLERRGGVAISHGLCPACFAAAMAELEGGAS